MPATSLAAAALQKADMRVGEGGFPVFIECDRVDELVAELVGPGGVLRHVPEETVREAVRVVLRRCAGGPLSPHPAAAAAAESPAAESLTGSSAAGSPPASDSEPTLPGDDESPPPSPPAGAVTRAPAPAPGWLRASECALADLRELVEVGTAPADYPLATEVVSNVTLYDRSRLNLSDPASARAAEAEMQRALRDGPGVIVIRGAFPDTAVVDRVTGAFDAIIAEEARAASGGKGDHFGAAGANTRVWGALDKLAARDPAAFVDYYSNDVIALASRCWLGPNYQVTSQVNIVRPGGAAQAMHRDYHLGFMSGAEAERYPAHVHDICPMLTLQGGVAHCDMPLESGPTMFLPHSQKLRDGYLVAQREEFKAYFAEHKIQLPLRKGDAVFFNPALLHAAGHNVTRDTARVMNLLQVSSAFGRAMESVDRAQVALDVYPSLVDAAARPGWGAGATRDAIAAAAEGYAFPTNLDRDPPVGGMAPPSQANIVSRAVAGGWPLAELRRQLHAADARRRPAAAQQH